MRCARTNTLAMAMLALAGALAGCNIVGPAAYFALGPDPVKAVYELDPERSVVVFVDDRVPRTSRAAREVIGASAEEALLKEKVVKDVIQSRAIQAVVSRERFGKPTGIADVGRAVGADVVIYAWVDAFTMTQDGQTFSPSAILRVKVIDVKTTERLYPPADAESAWHQLVVNVPPQQGFRPSTQAEQAKAEQDLARYVGLSLGRLFFEHQAPKAPSRLGEAAS